jgi:hypothetical protein
MGIQAFCEMKSAHELLAAWACTRPRTEARRVSSSVRLHGDGERPTADPCYAVP